MVFVTVRVRVGARDKNLFTSTHIIYIVPVMNFSIVSRIMKIYTSTNIIDILERLPWGVKKWFDVECDFRLNTCPVFRPVIFKLTRVKAKFTRTSLDQVICDFQFNTCESQIYTNQFWTVILACYFPFHMHVNRCRITRENGFSHACDLLIFSCAILSA